MGIFERLERLENEMHERKMKEKLKEYEGKYKREFETYIDSCHRMYLVVSGRMLALGYCPKKEEQYEKLCEGEIVIKAWLYDEMQKENKVEGEK